LERIAPSLRGCFTAAGQAEGGVNGSTPRRRCAASVGKLPRACPDEEGRRGLEAFRRPGQPAAEPLGGCPSCALCTDQPAGQGI
ncbi:MAG: hypothetical protein IKT16_10670, partial [Desulfovibrio sp.]|nr:hypothetical protein [Desulfovibrio sp.]